MVPMMQPKQSTDYLTAQKCALGWGREINYALPQQCRMLLAAEQTLAASSWGRSVCTNVYMLLTHQSHNGQGQAPAMNSVPGSAAPTMNMFVGRAAPAVNMFTNRAAPTMNMYMPVDPLHECNITAWSFQQCSCPSATAPQHTASHLNAPQQHDAAKATNLAGCYRHYFIVTDKHTDEAAADPASCSC